MAVTDSRARGTRREAGSWKSAEFCHKEKIREPGIEIPCAPNVG